MSDAVKLSLVIPCYNEGPGLSRLVARCEELTARIPCEVILVNNGSKDNSAEVLAQLTADKPALRVVNVEVNQGYGFGILSGLRAARGEIIGWTHADMQTDPMDSVTAYEMFKASADPARLFTKGRRYGRPLADQVFTLGMTIFETVLLGRVLYDVNAQPTCFPRTFFESWQNPPHDFSLDLFAYNLAKRARFDVKRHPVYFGKREHGQSSWNVNWSSKYKFIKRTVDYSLRLRRELPDSTPKT